MNNTFSSGHRIERRRVITNDFFILFSDEEARLGRSADSTLIPAGLNEAYPITLNSPYQWLYGQYFFKFMNTLFWW